MRRKKTLGDV
jgi:hypothetical protein